jgi:quinol monooxygenase YgiN
MIEALTTMAGLQKERNGLVTYHFAKPDPENRPNHLEFTEVYANEEAWWGHSADSEFQAAYLKGFGPTCKFESVTYGYGPGLQGKVKEVCDIVLKPKYPKSEAGFILNPQQWDTKPAAGEAVLVITRIQAKEGNATSVLQQLTKLSEVANSGVIVCHGSIPEEEKEPNVIELIEVCSTNDHLATHLTAGKDIFKSVIEAAEKVTCEGYGTILSTTSQLFTDAFGLSLGVRPTDTGYVLHSHADPAGK